MFTPRTTALASSIVVVFVILAPIHASGADGPAYAPVAAKDWAARDGLGNVLAKLKHNDEVRIAYLGGSITAASGWRVMTRQWFSDHYKSDIHEIHAAIGGTGSDLGVFRLGRDVLRHKPDLLFVEFAVNDGGAPPERIWRAMEGIVRQTWAANPRTDICFVYTYRVGYENDLKQGKHPQAAAAMEMLAAHYGIPTINLAKRIVEQEQQGKLIYKSNKLATDGVIRFSTDGVHPLEAGHRIYTDMIAETVTKMPQVPVDHGPKLAKPFITDHWQAAKMVPITSNMIDGDWKQLPSDNTLARRFGNRMGTLWEASEPGSSLTFRFRGSQAKLYDLLGPDGGQVIITVDGKTRKKPVPRFDSYCTYHRIATLMLADGLDPDAVHTIRIEIHPQQPDRTTVAFRLKDPQKELKDKKYQGTRIRASQIMLLGELVE